MINVKEIVLSDKKADLNIVLENIKDEMHAYYVKCRNDSFFDADCAAKIYIKDDFEIQSVTSVYMVSPYWSDAHISKDLNGIKNESNMVIVRYKTDKFSVILPVCGKVYKSTLGADENGAFVKMCSYSDSLNEIDELSFVCAEGKNPDELAKKCVRFSLDIMKSEVKTANQRKMPEIFKYLGWCSWDAMQIRVNEKDLLKKAEEFKEKNVPVKWMIIDDMWAEVKNFETAKYSNFEEMIDVMYKSSLFGFEADKKRFPKGLKECIKKLHNKGLKVGMWYPMSGYWNGIDKNSNLAKTYKDCLQKAPYRKEDEITYQHAGALIPKYGKETMEKFYSGFNGFLKECGADFVKIDRQSIIYRFYKGNAPVGEAAEMIHDIIENDVLKKFDLNLINCMGMAAENMWHRKNSAVCRCSDDFLPDNKAWFKKHIIQCAYNSILQGCFYICDWDMWWTCDKQAVKNSVLRAISGGPVYISDRLNETNADILKPLCDLNGKIYRCEREAGVCVDSVGKDPNENLFKINNKFGRYGFLAVFNLNDNDKPITGFISPGDVYDFEAEKAVLYEYFTGEYKILDKNEKLDITLKSGDDFRLYTVAPYENETAVLGDVSKYICAAAIKSKTEKSFELFESGNAAYVKNGKLFTVNNSVQIVFDNNPLK